MLFVKAPIDLLLLIAYCGNSTVFGHQIWERDVVMLSVKSAFGRYLEKVVVIVRH
ncbi:MULTISPECIES: hypothetical protein [unclassified Bartonella]|uniref:hypothetical protein n=1 Tax=unclassified Bartonella TaxID=2645622 RepID=UPI0035D0532F